MTNIVGEICAAIKRNPKIKRVIVSPLEHALIRREFSRMTFVRRDPRPTYKGPFGNVDRQLWDMKVAAQKLAPICILGRPVEKSQS